MSIEIWISFVIASSILCFSPGPTVFLVIGQSLAYGRKSIVPTVAGVISGDIVALTFSLLGVGAVLAASAVAFTILKWMGAVYLVYLGVKAWRSPVDDEETAQESVGNHWSVYKDSLVVTALNPKALIFFMAFFPLFISPESSNVLQQMLILAVTFLFVSMCSTSLYAYFGGRAKDYVSSVKARSRFNKVSGGVLIGAGVVTSTLER